MHLSLRISGGATPLSFPPLNPRICRLRGGLRALEPTSPVRDKCEQVLLRLIPHPPSSSVFCLHFPSLTTTFLTLSLTTLDFASRNPHAPYHHHITNNVQARSPHRPRRLGCFGPPDGHSRKSHLCRAMSTWTCDTACSAALVLDSPLSPDADNLDRPRSSSASPSSSRGTRVPLLTTPRFSPVTSPRPLPSSPSPRPTTSP